MIDLFETQSVIRKTLYPVFFPKQHSKKDKIPDVFKVLSGIRYKDLATSYMKVATIDKNKLKRSSSKKILLEVRL